MIFNLLLTIVFGYEIQKLLQFNFFFRLNSLIYEYKNNIKKRINSVIYPEITKVSLMELMYILTLLIGVFSKNLYFFVAILMLSNINIVILKNIKNKSIKKTFFFIDIILSIILLGLALANNLFFNLESIDFLNKILA